VERLTDFKPLGRVVLPDVGPLDYSGLILIVGPNSSGKTHLLQDLYQRLTGVGRTLVTATAIGVRKPAELEPFLKCLEREGLIKRYVDPNGNTQIRPLTTYLGSGQFASQISENQPGELYRTFSVEDAERARPVAFLSYFGRMLVTGLFLDRRLASLGSVPVFDHETTSPQHEIQSLFIESDARKALLAESRGTFQKSVWPDGSRGTLCLRVSDSRDAPTAEDLISPKSMGNYRTIDTEGDGLKSYIAICVALLLGLRPVCVIDEPEMCLHPPQAYNLGRFIGRYGSSPDRSTFVATHSSHVLRGVIQTTNRLQIVRLTRRDSSFHAHLVPSEVLKNVLERPTVRAETVLDGIFSQAVVVVESEGDKTVYQAVLETLNKEFQLDLHFTAVNGIGGISETCRLYQTLKIPVAVIADLDMISDASGICRVLTELRGVAPKDSLRTSLEDLALKVKKIPPTIDSAEVKRRLQQIAGHGMDWANDQDVPIQKAVQELSRELDRMRRIKGGLSKLPKPIADDAKGILVELASCGLFLVPVGELEGWLDFANIEVSRRKWAWAIQAATKVHTLGPQNHDVWDFVRSVATFLSKDSMQAVAESV